MAKGAKKADFNTIVAALKQAGFEVSAASSGSAAASDFAAGSVLVSKYGTAAVLGNAENAVAIVAGPGALIHGKIAYLFDRGFQKFLKTAEFEIPATAVQLGAIHRFEEELKELIGADILFNQALGTTSDLYHYDRVRGREKEQARGVSPWQAVGSH